MLIAADGPNSAITRQLTDNKVRAYDTGARMIHGQSPSWAFKQLGEGVWSVMDDSRQDGSTVGLITNVRPGSLGEDNELGWVAVGSAGAFTAPGDNFSIVGKGGMKRFAQSFSIRMMLRQRSSRCRQRIQKVSLNGPTTHESP